MIFLAKVTFITLSTYFVLLHLSADLIKQIKLYPSGSW